MDNLEKVKRIGRGTFADVYLVIDKGTNKHFALKELEMLVDDNIETMSIQEAELLRELTHPSIVK